MTFPIYGGDNPDFNTQTGNAYKGNIDAVSAGLHQGNIGNPLLDLPLMNSLVINKGVGSVIFTRSTIATEINRYGTLRTVDIDEPRFEKNGLLMEGASTNLLTRSEDFGHSDWFKGTTSITSGATTGPDEEANSADKLVEDSSTGTHLMTQSDVAFDDSANHSLSLFVKAAERSKGAIKVRTITQADSFTVVFDLVAGTVGAPFSTGLGAGISAYIEELIDGWFRIELTGNCGSSGSFGLAADVFLDDGSGLSYTGDGTSGMYIFGAQLEELSLASSYIPTVATAVTRTRETCTLDIYGNVGLQANAGTLLADFDVLENNVGSFQDVVSVNGETFRLLRAGLTASLLAQGFWGDAGGIGTTAIIPKTTYRAGLKFDGADASYWLSGLQKGSAVSPDVSDALGHSITVGSVAGGNDLFGHISNLRIYEGDLSDREMTIA